MLADMSCRSTFLSLPSAVLLLSAIFPVSYGGPLEPRLPRPYHLCDGPVVADTTAAVADCASAASEIIQGLDGPAIDRQLQWYSARGDAASGGLPPPPSQTLPRIWTYKRCQITLDLIPGVQPAQVVRQPARDSMTVASLGTIHRLAEEVTRDCVSFSRRPRGYRDVGLMVSSLRVSVSTKLDFESAMKDPQFATEAKKLLDPTQLDTTQRDDLRSRLRKYLAYGFERYNYPV